MTNNISMLSEIKYQFKQGNFIQNNTCLLDLTQTSFGNEIQEFRILIVLNLAFLYFIHDMELLINE